MTTYIIETTTQEAYARMMSGGGAAFVKRFFEVVAENETKAKEKAEQLLNLEEEIIRVVEKVIFDIEQKEEEERIKRWREERKKELEEDLQIRAERKQELNMTVKKFLQKIQTEIDLGHLNENAKVYKSGYKITDVWNFTLKIDNDGDLRIY